MEEYRTMTFKNALGLSAPHSWMASICPVLLGTVLSFGLEGKVSLPLFFALLAAALLMHCSVNTLNDYYDFIKGTDSVENSDDPNDAIMVYNRLNPRHVRSLGFAFLGAALLFGCYAVYRGGFIPLVIGVIGGVVVLTYSAGKLPVSHMPVGELVSGGAMGGLITLAAFASYTGYIDARVLYMSLPLVLGIGLLMMTNNICDIERDIPSGRKTLPVILGRERSTLIYRLAAPIWLLILPHIIYMWFPKGLPVLLAGIALLSPVFWRLLRLDMRPEKRMFCLGAILKANIGAHCVYLAGILAGIILQ